MLSRHLRDLRGPQQQQQLPVAEVQLQVDYTPQQAEAYKTLLVRNFEILADPKPPRYGLLLLSHGARFPHRCH